MQAGIYHRSLPLQMIAHKQMKTVSRTRSWRHRWLKLPITCARKSELLTQHVYWSYSIKISWGALNVSKHLEIYPRVHQMSLDQKFSVWRRMQRWFNFCWLSPRTLKVIRIAQISLPNTLRIKWNRIKMQLSSWSLTWQTMCKLTVSGPSGTKLWAVDKPISTMTQIRSRILNFPLRLFRTWEE